MTADDVVAVSVRPSDPHGQLALLTIIVPTWVTVRDGRTLPALLCRRGDDGKRYLVVVDSPSPVPEELQATLTVQRPSGALAGLVVLEAGAHVLSDWLRRVGA